LSDYDPLYKGPGDLYIFIRVAADDIFQRQEYDVYCRLNLSFSQAALGAEIEVPLLNDETKIIKVKPETQSGEMMRITGAGIPHVRGHGRGDQIIQMMIETHKN
jgi:molecular chaperone DnaJ